MESPSASTFQVGLPDSSSLLAGNRPQEDVASLTSFNPFSEEDEHDQSSYALMTSLFSRVKNTFTTPLSSAPLVSNGTGAAVPSNNVPAERRRPSASVIQNLLNDSSRSSHERPPSMTVISSHIAPPLVSLTPVVSEGLTFNCDFDLSLSRAALINPSASDGLEGGPYGTTIPGFSIPEDARSIRTAPSVRRSASVSKVIRRIRGEGESKKGKVNSLFVEVSQYPGLSRDYWMDDKTCKECYDCKSVFTAWRRKHHCRICGPSWLLLVAYAMASIRFTGQIFCSRCASNIIKGSRFGHDGMIRVCNLCLEKLAANEDEDDDDDRRSISSVASPFAAHQFGSDVSLARHPQSPFAASQLFGRTEEPFNLFSIAETRRFISGSDDSGFSSRPMTPLGRSQEDSWGPQAWKAAAPFRRGLADDDKDLSIVTDTFPQVGSPMVSGVKTPLDLPATIPIPGGALNSIQFPLSSPERAPDSPGPQSVPRSRYNSYADFEASTPFIRSRVPSRLTDFMMAGDPGWRTRRESTQYIFPSYIYVMLTN
jgi:1-phosphatidylinositol-3-phosphate 5-kinase